MPPDIEAPATPGAPTAPATRPVVKRTARAILLDGDSLVLIKRTKPGLNPYWVTPGGGVEAEDATIVEALHRELDEELGAKVTDVVPAFVDTVEHIGEDGSHGVKVQHFFVCRLASMDPSRRHGPEVDEPSGTYDVVRVPFSRVGLASVEIVPLTLRHYLDGNIEGVLGLLSADLG
ncbi:NUDIX domain-containing protein [Actinacidiphila glaucinigra]|uniref:8-oxo-dGTP pyrophosphatase MutT, NUDIX family n=1 Tax=Actinacidiphila glaucinigra TaxID=235986 RepID=A0A239I0N6_9ACTN|nr:NUDIX hydrolase [Actinacidiphila glaucinigra]WSD61109.1 NUDIX hydrolase [Actinacidiphila glaucinigra]SNS87107.1 8-oxo-dGTP pyrophosphatase MutT, NUDIX family [Actinacidiphila glaucinigra]